RKRLRHLPTVCLVTRSSRATAVLVFPAAQPRIRRARSAVAWAVFGRRAHPSSSSRSSALSVIGGVARPWRMGVFLSTGRTPARATLFHESRSQATSHSRLGGCSSAVRADRPRRLDGFLALLHSSCSPKACYVR